MASTYSTLKIELIGTGEQSGTWGTTTNTNLGTAIEEAIVGSADVSFSSADVTLTLTDTNAAQSARNLRLNLTGTSGGARNLILGSGCQIEKPYLINNGLADTVTVKNTTGTGIAVPAGKSMWVYNNGTNVVDAVTHLTSLTLGSALPIASGGTGSTSTTFVNLTTNVTGTLPIANGGTGSTSTTFVNLTTNVTGTLPVANGGTGITAFGTGVATALGQNVSGSGSIALTTSPTFVTPVLGAATGTSLALTGGSLTTRPAATQDGVVVSGRAGGTSSYNVTITPTTLTDNRTLTLANGNTTLQAGTMAVTGSGLNQFASTTSAELAGVISDETGSGSLVFATSPTLVTPVLGAATGTSLALTGGSLTARPAATQDAVVVAGRAGGTQSYTVTITPTTLSGSRTLTLADGNTTLQTGTMAVTGTGLGQFASTTSSQLAGVISDETGSGSLVFATSPTLVTPTLGVATATSINKVAITAPATSATLTIANGKTLTANNSLTLAGTDATTMTFPSTSQTIAGLGLTQTFTAAQTFRAASAIRSEAASTQDAIVIAGRAGGSNSYAITLTPATLAASRTLTLPEPGSNETLGYINTPIISQSAAYTLVLTDAGKTILHPDSDNNARTFTIPADGSVAYPVGTVITFVNMINTVTIAITTDTMYLAGPGTTGSRTLAAYGVATAVKLTSTTWLISGNGLT
jgi:hypothetical protein